MSYVKKNFWRKSGKELWMAPWERLIWGKTFMGDPDGHHVILVELVGLVNFAVIFPSHTISVRLLSCLLKALTLMLIAQLFLDFSLLFYPSSCFTVVFPALRNSNSVWPKVDSSFPCIAFDYSWWLILSFMSFGCCVCSMKPFLLTCQQNRFVVCKAKSRYAINFSGRVLKSAKLASC